MSSDIWQLSIITDTNKTIPIFINKNASVAQLFKQFRELNKVYKKENRLSLLTADGELNENDNTRIVDHDYLRDKASIRLIVHTDGGGLPTQYEMEQQIRDPTKVASLAGKLTTDLPDMMGMDDEIPRVKMSCGHVIAPSSLALYCRVEIENGASKIHCPDPDCDAAWSFTSIVNAACLSEKETDEFEQMMISNSLCQSTTIKQCPGCGNSCSRLQEDKPRIRCKKCTSEKGRNFDFCWLCLMEWNNSSKAWFCGNPQCGDLTSLYQCLANCDTKTLNGVECPSRRACPSCLMLIEHTDKCKHMKCHNKKCKYNFCFICLEHYPCKTGPHDPCELAPRQQPTSPGPAASNSWCSIQ